MSTFEPVWGPVIAGYLFLAGLGAGAFLFAFILELKFPQAVKMRRFAHILTPVAVALGLVLLLADAPGALHNPLRILLLFSNLQSVMTWGVYFLIIFFAVSAFVMIIELKKDYILPRSLNIIGVIAAFCVALYTGVLLGVCKTFPLWNNALLPILFLVSALSAGAAALLLYAALFAPAELKGITGLRKLQYLLPVIELVLLASLLFITFYNSSAGAASVLMLVTGSWSPWFWVGLVFCGLLLHLIVETKPLFFSAGGAASHGALARYTDVGLNALALCGGFLLRLLIVMAAMPLAIAV
ncbi:MAG: polysulfide reductase NrfD [Coriobacteriales bacterium]|nr:polysulfide reductase NrfD [Coriobacteriales bacterium]